MLASIGHWLIFSFIYCDNNIPVIFFLSLVREPDHVTKTFMSFFRCTSVFFSTCKCRYVIKMIFCFVCIWYLIIDGKDKMQYELKKTPVNDLFKFCIDFCKEWESEKGRLLKTAIQNYGRFFKNTVSNYYDIIRMIQYSVTKKIYTF